MSSWVFVSNPKRRREKKKKAIIYFNEQDKIVQHKHKQHKVGERGGTGGSCNMRTLLYILSAFLNTINNVSTCCLHQKHSQILCISMTLPLNLDFSFSGNAAKELHVLYTKIEGSYFNLWELDGFPKTKCFTELSVIKPLLQQSNKWQYWMISLCVEINQMVGGFFPRWLGKISTDVWQAIDWMRIYSGLLRLITSSV